MSPDRTQRKKTEVVNQQQRTQSRRHERAPVNLPLSYSVDPDRPPRAGRAIDLSGGGIRISGPAHLVKDTPIVLGFSLPRGSVEVLARGKAVMSFFDGSRQEYVHGIAFTHIGKVEQGAIIEHVHQTQPLIIRPETAA